MTGTFTDGTVLSALALNGAINSFTLNAQTGTAYPLVLSDAGKLVTLSNASAITVTVPANATHAFPIGTCVSIANLGVGGATITGAGGVTVSGTLSLSQNDTLSLIKTGTDTWLSAAGGLPKASISATTGSPTVDTSSRPGKTIYKYLGSGTFVIANDGYAEFQGAAGGGGAAGVTYGGGGGGAGGLAPLVVWLVAGTYTVTVGAGGAGAANAAASNGSMTRVVGPNMDVKIPGGAGGPQYSAPGTIGACGSGASVNAGGTMAGGLGLIGGNGQTDDSGGSGGGMGGNAGTGDNPGPGVATPITGSSVTYCRGGRSGQYAAGESGTANSGNGGNGRNGSTAGGNGGSGHVMVVTG